MRRGNVIRLGEITVFSDARYQRPDAVGVAPRQGRGKPRFMEDRPEVIELAVPVHGADRHEQEDGMREQEFIAPSKRQRWGIVLVALVVAGVVVTRGGTPQPTQAQHLQPWHDGVEITEPDLEWRSEVETGELDRHVPPAGSKSK